METPTYQDGQHYQLSHLQEWVNEQQMNEGMTMYTAELIGKYVLKCQKEIEG